MSDQTVTQAEKTVTVKESELLALIAQNKDLKADVIALVNVFASFTGLFSGKSVAGMIPTIMKLLNDKSKLAAIEHVVPIIDKYLQNGEETNG